MCDYAGHKKHLAVMNISLMRTHPAGEDAQGPLVDVHDRIVLPLVAIHFLKNRTRSSDYLDALPFQIFISDTDVTVAKLLSYFLCFL